LAKAAESEKEARILRNFFQNLFWIILNFFD
jgi:hypothetical protein